MYTHITFLPLDLKPKVGRLWKIQLKSEDESEHNLNS